MQPFSEFTDQLFIAAGADPSRILEFSCGHVIPPTSILPIIVCSGPTGKTFDFSFEFRNNFETVSFYHKKLTHGYFKKRSFRIKILATAKKPTVLFVCFS